jgi:hypothetical protein
MCVPIQSAFQMLAIAVTGLTVGLMLPSRAQADRWWIETARSECAGNPVQIGTDMDPEKDTVGLGCLVKDAEYSGSVARPSYSQNDRWEVGPVDHVAGDAEHDIFGYLRRAQ